MIVWWLYGCNVCIVGYANGSPNAIAQPIIYMVINDLMNMRERRAQCKLARWLGQISYARQVVCGILFVCGFK